MSRHTLPAKAGQNLKIAIGWDRPLETYFVLATDADDESKVLLWKGTSPGELGSAAAAIDELRPYAEIPPDLHRRLEIDRLAASGRADSSLQRTMKAMIVRTPPPSR